MKEAVEYMERDTSTKQLLQVFNLLKHHVHCNLEPF